MKRKLIFSVMLIFVMAFSLGVSSCGNEESKLIGIWEDDDQSDIIEFQRNGTGKWDGSSMTWSINEKKLTVTAFGDTVTFGYNIKGSVLTLTYEEDGDVYNTLKRK